MSTTSSLLLTDRKKEILSDLLEEVRFGHFNGKHPFSYVVSTQVIIYCDDWVPRVVIGEKDLDNGRHPIKLQFTLSKVDGGNFTYDVEEIE